jgi:hypothetical protein
MDNWKKQTARFLVSSVRFGNYIAVDSQTSIWGLVGKTQTEDHAFERDVAFKNGWTMEG